MNNKQHFLSLLWHRTRKIILVCSLFSVFFMANVKADNYQLDIVTQLKEAQTESSNWLQLISHPSNDQQYFAINKAGQLYFVDDEQKQHEILDLNINRPKKSALINVTAIELHPNFSLRDQPGYGLFYTAHLEEFDDKVIARRIQERSSEIIVKFDAVITEWKFNASDDYNVALNTKREVLRVTVPDRNISIKQMTFNPYIKSWNEGFGLLYIALNGDKKWNKPLYSGVILRINPTKFGLRSFTVPTTNPYMQNSEIKDEIYLLGGQEIKQFIWPDKSSDNILLSHRYQNQSLLSLSDGRDDWRSNPPKIKLYQGKSNIEDALLYRGRNLPYLRNKLLILTKKNKQWFVSSLNMQSLNNQASPTINTLQQEWQFTHQHLTNSNDVKLSANRDGEVLVLDKTGGVVFKLSQKHSATTDKTIEKPASITPKSESTAYIYILFIVLVGLGLSAFYLVNKRKFSAKKVVRTQFASIELSESQQQISLYHRHQVSADTTLDIANITRCEAEFNEQSIMMISTSAGWGFNAHKEQDLRERFTKERVHKMVDGKVRQVSLLFTDNNNKKYRVCLYMRKGSERITKKKYAIVIDDVIDWCWLISEHINFDGTGKRKEKPMGSSAPVMDSIGHRETETALHNQAAAIRATTHHVEKVPPSIDVKTEKEQQASVGAVEENKEEGQSSQNKSIDTEVVNALEKLVNLKQQGFLTEVEFTKAKENLLRGLFDK